MATQTTNPRRTARTTTKAVKPTAVIDEETVESAPETEEVTEVEIEKFVYEPQNRGRTKQGEGKMDHWNLHESFVRGNIFADPSVIQIRVLVVRNPNAK